MLLYNGYHTLLDGEESQEPPSPLSILRENYMDCHEIFFFSERGMPG